MMNLARGIPGIMVRLYLCLSFVLIAAGIAIELRWIYPPFSGWLAILAGIMLFLYSVRRLARWWRG
jgi:hypothetical protein